MRCRYCDRDIEVVVINNIIIVNRCIYFREMFKCFSYGFNVERYKVKMNIMVFFEVFLILFMKFYNGFYVNFVKCG